jgi:four helix bundle protein
MEPLFDHEKLDVYGVELQFIGWLAEFLGDVTGSSTQHRRELIEQLDRASLSMLLNTAEGNGKRYGRHRAKFFDDARGSAFECAACLDASVAKRIVSADRIRTGKEMLARVGSDAHPLDRSLRHRRSPPSQVTIPLTRARPRVASLNHPQSCSCLCSVFVRCR